MDIRSAPVMAFRWTTFLLAGGYCLHVLLAQDHSSPGGPFRYLTIWALFLSFYSASRMLAQSEGRMTRRHARTAAVAAVVNGMVLLLHWQVVVTEPALVQTRGASAWHEHYYLHVLGPALQIFDALFIARVFRRPWRALPPLLAFVTAYLIWADFVVKKLEPPLADGLGFDRIAVHATTLLLALIVLAGLAALSRLIRGRSGPMPSHPAPQ